MSTTELLNRIEHLSQDDYNIVVMLVDRLYSQSTGIKKLSEDELFEELTKSIERSDSGYTKPARSVSAEMRQKYAI
ncbi:MAG: hypothetical protein K6A38_02670 [Lachnospiraceae bacterium]|nr:hypothetical protein [Lachnospiraceae bacterium]